jgi:MFS family permease
VAPAAAAPARGRLHTFVSLRHRNYRRLFVGVLFTSGGLWMEQIALNWLVYDLTGSAVYLSLLNAARVVPSLFASPIGGLAADRVSRKDLMLWTQWTLLTLYVGLGSLIVLGRLQVWHLLAFSLLSGIAWSFNQPVRQAVMPSLVPPEEMANAAALQTAGHHSTRVLGPAAVGFLIGAVGAAGAIFAEAATSVVVLVATYAMRVPPHPPRVGKRPGLTHDLAEGFRYIARTPDVRSLIVLGLVPFVLVFPYVGVCKFLQGLRRETFSNHALCARGSVRELTSSYI